MLSVMLIITKRVLRSKVISIILTGKCCSSSNQSFMTTQTIDRVAHSLFTADTLQKLFSICFVSILIGSLCYSPSGSTNFIPLKPT